MRHAAFPMPAMRWGCWRHAAALGRVPPQTHVQTGLARTVVPHPSILPSAFASRIRSRQSRSGGAAASAASAPGNTPMAAGRARSRQDVCTWDGCAECKAGCCAECRATAQARHARRHNPCSRKDLPESTTGCTAMRSQSAASHAVPDAPDDGAECSPRCGAECNANALALHARRHSDDTPDSTKECTFACSKSAAIMDVSPTRPDAPRRSRRMR